MHNAAFYLRYKLHHVFFWMLVFGTWYFLRYEDYSLPVIAFRITLVKVVDLALMVYITNYLLIPRLLYKKKYFWFFLAFVLMVLTSSITKMNILGKIMHNPQLFSFSGNLKGRIYDNVIPHFFLVIAGAAVKLVVDYTRMQKRMAEMAKEKAEAELNFLKSQVNPHFLFNSLNSVYFLIDKGNTDARNALHKFSEMLRFQLYDAGGEKIPIEKEIAYLKDYVDMQRLRREQSDEVSFEYNDGLSGFSIEPLLLIPFVENSFKHLSHFGTGNKNKVKIEANRKNGIFHFSVANTVEYNSTREPIGGIGLKNVKRRLELLYPEKHELSIKEENNMFTVDLKLKIDN
ncbi:MAG: hypothetical protein EPN92_08100 [Chitinophagaceae bacterium]|nr:MAG: hypothetical protein EPN92_08100 [Chitinophagaceae bacterium]